MARTSNTMLKRSGERQGWGIGEMGEGGQKVQNSSYKISSEDIMYSMPTIVNNTGLYILKLLRE